MFAVREKFSSRAFLSLSLCVFTLTGCVSPDVQQAQKGVAAYFMGDMEQARQLLRPVAQKPDENFVLNNARLGSATLIDFRLDEAEGAFFRAYEVINSVGVNSGGRSLGATFVDEKIKIWKGEPFERAMVNFYLGVIYYMRQDYGNARAALENALFKLRDYDQNAGGNSDKYNAVDSDFALGYYMLAKCWQRLGRDDFAKANFDRVQQLRPDLAGLPDENWNRDSNLLLVVDYGFGPRKQTNSDGAVVGFVPDPLQVGPMMPALVRVDGRIAPTGGIPYALVDLLSLAQDRRWQSIDTIRAVKSALGTGMIVGGLGTAALSHDRDAQAIGLGVAAIGLLLKASSQADVRQWEMLPRGVYLIPLKVAPGRHDIAVEIPSAEGSRQAWQQIVVPKEGEATYYFRLMHFNTGPYQWPPAQSQLPAAIDPSLAQ